MITPDQIPDDVVNAYMHMIVHGGVDGAEAIAAALNAWPGNTMESREVLNFGNNIDGPVVSAKRLPFLILPLPQKGDE